MRFFAVAGMGVFPSRDKSRKVFEAAILLTYYLMISARYNNQALVWGQAVQLRAGANSVTLSPGNAIPVN